MKVATFLEHCQPKMVTYVQLCGEAMLLLVYFKLTHLACKSKNAALDYFTVSSYG